MLLVVTLLTVQSSVATHSAPDNLATGTRCEEGIDYSSTPSGSAETYHITSLSTLYSNPWHARGAGTPVDPAVLTIPGCGAKAFEIDISNVHLEIRDTTFWKENSTFIQFHAPLGSIKLENVQVAHNSTLINATSGHVKISQTTLAEPMNSGTIGNFEKASLEFANLAWTNIEGGATIENSTTIVHNSALIGSSSPCQNNQKNAGNTTVPIVANTLGRDSYSSIVPWQELHNQLDFLATLNSALQEPLSDLKTELYGLENQALDRPANSVAWEHLKQMSERTLPFHPCITLIEQSNGTLTVVRSLLGVAQKAISSQNTNVALEGAIFGRNAIGVQALDNLPTPTRLTSVASSFESVGLPYQLDEQFGHHVPIINSSANPSMQRLFSVCDRFNSVNAPLVATNNDSYLLAPQTLGSLPIHGSELDVFRAPGSSHLDVITVPLNVGSLMGSSAEGTACTVGPNTFHPHMGYTMQSKAKATGTPTEWTLLGPLGEPIKSCAHANCPNVTGLLNVPLVYEDHVFWLAGPVPGMNADGVARVNLQFMKAGAGPPCGWGFLLQHISLPGEPIVPSVKYHYDEACWGVDLPPLPDPCNLLPACLGNTISSKFEPERSQYSTECAFFSIEQVLPDPLGIVTANNVEIEFTRAPFTCGVYRCQRPMLADSPVPCGSDPPKTVHRFEASGAGFEMINDPSPSVSRLLIQDSGLSQEITMGSSNYIDSSTTVLSVGTDEYSVSVGERINPGQYRLKQQAIQNEADTSANRKTTIELTLNQWVDVRAVPADVVTDYPKVGYFDVKKTDQVTDEGNGFRVDGDMGSPSCSPNCDDAGGPGQPLSIDRNLQIPIVGDQLLELTRNAATDRVVVKHISENPIGINVSMYNTKLEAVEGDAWIGAFERPRQLDQGNATDQIVAHALGKSAAAVASGYKLLTLDRSLVTDSIAATLLSLDGEAGQDWTLSKENDDGTETATFNAGANTSPLTVDIQAGNNSISLQSVSTLELSGNEDKGVLTINVQTLPLPPTSPMRDNASASMDLSGTLQFEATGLNSLAYSANIDAMTFDGLNLDLGGRVHTALTIPQAAVGTIPIFDHVCTVDSLIQVTVTRDDDVDALYQSEGSITFAGGTCVTPGDGDYGIENQESCTVREAEATGAWVTDWSYPTLVVATMPHEHDGQGPCA